MKQIRICLLQDLLSIQISVNVVDWLLPDYIALNQGKVNEDAFHKLPEPLRQAVIYPPCRHVRK